MQDVIREGSLRLLATESSCDVIISCLDLKLMAHKIILSIASPVLQELLRENVSQQPTMLIFPDVEATTMSLILDYIYSGHVTLLFAQIAEFLTLAKLLRIQLEDDSLKVLVNAVEKQPKLEVLKKEDAIKMKKCVPDLIPIARSTRVRERRIRALFNKVIPSPWTPRDKEVLLDPRSDRLMIACNDSNNNIESTSTSVALISAAINKEAQYNATIVKSKCSDPSPTPSSTIALDKKHTEVLKERDKPKTKSLSSSPPPSTKTSASADNQDASDKPKKDKPYKCEDCDKQFSQFRNYKYHRSIHDGTKEFSTRCPECGKVFSDRGYLSSHMKIHRDRKEYACQHCPKRFNQRVAYNMHLRIHTGVKPHECDVCGKSFSRKMLLKQHQRVHTGERPYTCAECGKSFADRSNMTLHARLHTGVKPYSCTLCPKSFTKKHHLKTHMNFHTGLKPYSCANCGLSFSQSSNMRTHYKKCILKADADTQVAANATTS